MDINDITAEEIIDTCGLSCPMPLLKTKKALKGMESNQILEVLGNDPGSKNDIPDWGNKGGNQFLGMVDADNGITRFFIKKG